MDKQIGKIYIDIEHNLDEVLSKMREIKELSEELQDLLGNKKSVNLSINSINPNAVEEALRDLNLIE